MWHIKARTRNLTLICVRISFAVRTIPVVLQIGAATNNPIASVSKEPDKYLWVLSHQFYPLTDLYCVSGAARWSDTLSFRPEAQRINLKRSIKIVNLKWTFPAFRHRIGACRNLVAVSHNGGLLFIFACVPKRTGGLPFKNNPHCVPFFKLVRLKYHKHSQGTQMK